MIPYSKLVTMNGELVLSDSFNVGKAVINASKVARKVTDKPRISFGIS